MPLLFFKRVAYTAIGTLCGLPLGVTLYGSVLPNDWTVERTVVIDAPISDVYPLLSSSAAWTRWAAGGSGLLGDPEFLGPPSGVGAGYRWSGRGVSIQVEITEADPNQGVSYRSEVTGLPTVTGTIHFFRDQGGTRVVWTEVGKIQNWPFGGYFVARHKREQGHYEDSSLQLLRMMAERATTKDE